MSSKVYGQMPDGREVREYTLDNGRGLVLKAINLGGIVTELHCPDAQGRSASVVLGLASLDDYVRHNRPYFGVLVGRYAGRIAGARFTLDGEAHLLNANEGPNTLHGGLRGFGSRYWAIEELGPQAGGELALELRLVSEHGDENYPGRLDVTVRYTLTPANEFRVDYRATTDRPTVVNLTHHGYFNLRGEGTALEHELTLNASRFLPVDARLVSTGALAEVAGTAFDFRRPRRIADRINDAETQLVLANGYDHCYLIDGSGAGQLAFCATLADPASGRVMDLLTTEPGVQFYSGNFLDGRLRGAKGQAHRQGDGVCLETQHYPRFAEPPRIPVHRAAARRDLQEHDRA